MNTIDKNDPRLTAYALGELSSDEKLEIENALETQPDLQEVIDEVHNVTKLLEDAFATEDILTLNEEARDEVKDVASETVSKPFPIRFYLSRVVIPIAAMIVLAIYIPSSDDAKSINEVDDNVILDIAHEVQEARQLEVDADVTDKETAKKLTLNVADSLKKEISPNLPPTLKEQDSVAQKSVKNSRNMVKTNVNTLSRSNLSKECRKVKAVAFEGILPSINVSQSVGAVSCGLIYRPPCETVVPVSQNESYGVINENGFIRTKDEPLSTFSIDVDTASYSNIRRFLTRNQLPPSGSVRIEEMINYFTYDYPKPKGNVPFSVTTDVSTAPWDSSHKLVRIGMKGKEIAKENRPMSNLVFLLDVSGSMNSPNKLPLLKKGMKMLVEQLGENDRVAIVVYAGASGLVLPSTGCSSKDVILDALDRLRAGGSTNGSGGIQLAYQIAVKNYIKGGINRVILATDGDFNVGTTNRSDLIDLIKKKAQSGVYLSVLGFGMGNYKDNTLEDLADKGNGNYAYIDTIEEAKKVLIKEMGSTLVTIAKDVKIQVDFNPQAVEAYRLIGYENRMMSKEDFNNDKKDAGEIGAGHTVTALYEIIPVGATVQLPKVDPSKYLKPTTVKKGINSNELLEVRVRYKQPNSETSSLLKFPLVDSNKPFASMNDDFRFATGVAIFGMILRDSKFVSSMSLDDVIRMAESSKDKPYRGEFIELVKKAKRLKATR